MTLVTPAHSLESLRLESDQQQVQIVFCILLALPVAFGVTEALNADRPLHVGAASFALRIVLLGVMLGLITRLRRFRTRAAFVRAVTWALSIGVVLILIQHVLRQPDRLLPFVVEGLLITTFYAFMPLTRYRQSAIAGALTAGSLALLFLWHDNVSLQEQVGVATSLIAANALGVASLWHRQQRERREERVFAREQEARSTLEQTLAELRVLRGVLPICAHCRQIRAQDGDWQPLDDYVRAHTDADFSHGICPSCLDEHYQEHVREGLAVGQ